VTGELFPDGIEPWFNGDIAARRLEGDEWLVVRPMIYSFRVAVMSAGNASIEHWCYGSTAEALVCWVTYPEIVPNWKRHQRRDRTMERPPGYVGADE
jgi:hypothetical protein